jgi:hypothetical protein
VNVPSVPRFTGLTFQVYIAQVYVATHLAKNVSEPRKEPMIERSQVNAAKIFGITYLLSLAIITVVFSRFYAPYLVWGNGEETARHFIAHEQAVRL